MNKAIYMPKGKAGEYAKYACNFYIGCSNDCAYCYCKKGILGHAMGKPQAKLKKCFKDKNNAYGTFIRELHDNYPELHQHGIFFTFTSDPLLPETQELTNAAVLYAVSNNVPCQILTKRADFNVLLSFDYFKDKIAYGFTLTGRDELEPGASPNLDRIEKMRTLHEKGFKTFASIEPIINLESSYNMIDLSINYCDLYKIGLMSGKRDYTPQQVGKFMLKVHTLIKNHNCKVYWKDSVWQYIKANRETFNSLARLAGLKNIVNSDYNIFNTQKS